MTRTRRMSCKKRIWNLHHQRVPRSLSWLPDMSMECLLGNWKCRNWKKSRLMDPPQSQQSLQQDCPPRKSFIEGENGECNSNETEKMRRRRRGEGRCHTTNGSRAFNQLMYLKIQTKSKSIPLDTTIKQFPAQLTSYSTKTTNPNPSASLHLCAGRAANNIP